MKRCSSRSTTYRRAGLAVMAALMVGLSAAATGATGLSVAVGPVFESNFYPQFGARASVSHFLLLGAHPRLTVSYTTSRISAFAGRNVLKKDDILFNAGWYFRPGKLINPYAGVDVGLTRFERENDELFELLYNKSAVLNARIGLTSDLLGGRIRPSIDGGLAILSVASSAPMPVFPFFFRLGIDLDIAKVVLP